MINKNNYSEKLIEFIKSTKGMEQATILEQMKEFVVEGTKIFKEIFPENQDNEDLKSGYSYLQVISKYTDDYMTGNSINFDELIDLSLAFTLSLSKFLEEQNNDAKSV